MLRKKIVFVAVLLATAAPAFAQGSGAMPPAPSVIATQGEATVKRAADRAWIAVASESRAPKPADAQRLAATAMTNVQNALKLKNLGADAIRTTSYSVQPDMDYSSNPPRVKGYIARNQIEVRVDMLDQLSEVIDVAGASGATSIAGVRFDLKNREAVEAEALRGAVQNAMKRAEVMASGAGRTLGNIIRLEETGADMPRPMPMMAMRSGDMAQQAQTPMSPGEIEITSRVALTIAIR